MIKITRHPVTSSQIVSIGYDLPTKQLTIEFKPFKPKEGVPNSVYLYQNVEPETHAALIGAESIGRAFGQGIKKDPQRWPHRKLTPEEAAQ
jgi:hypothetical protein